MKYMKECPLLLLVFLSSFLIIGLKTGGKLGEENLYIENVSAGAIGMEEQINSENVQSISENEVLTAENSSLEDSSLSENETVQTYEFEKVEESYFNDALFIGDSRTVGLQDYSKNLGNAVFYAKTGLTIQNLLSSPLVEVGDKKEKITIEEALNHYSFGKIYLMVGINELGRGTTATFLEDYTKVVARIRELQPEAIIFVEAIMKVSEEKSNTDAIFNNQNIEARNEAIRVLENKADIFYLDINEAVSDENGNLKKEYSFDGVHLKAVHYNIWEEFLKANGIVY